MKVQVSVLTFVAAFSLGLAYPFKTCSLSSPDHEKCLNEAIESALKELENGLPEIHFPNVQPFNVTSMTIGEGSGAVHVVQRYNDVMLYNVLQAKIKKSEVYINGNEFKLSLETYHDEIIMKADYDFNGNILVVPIVGVGKCTLTLKNLSSHLDLIGEIVEKKEKRHVEIKDLKMLMDPGKAEYNFENLFNGDKTLGDEMNKILNDNGLDVFKDVKKGYEEAMAGVIKNCANLVFKKLDADEIFSKSVMTMMDLTRVFHRPGLFIYGANCLI